MSERLHEQLSALLDGELPAGEAELLLARLQRDPALRATLGRYTLAGDAIRVASLEAAPQVAPVASAGFAARISAAIEAEAQQEASLLAGMGVAEAVSTRATAGSAPVMGSMKGSATALTRGRRAAVRRWLRPLGGVAVAASVAGLALMVVPQGAVGPGVPVAVSASAVPSMGGGTLVAQPQALPAALPAPVLASAASPAANSGGLVGLGRAGEPASYTTPLSTGGQAPTFIPAAELASYVVAHSEVSGPLARRNVLTGLAAEPAPANASAQPGASSVAGSPDNAFGAESGKP